MLSRLFGPKKRAKGTQLAMPLFRTTEGLTAESIAAAWENLFPDRPPLVAEPDDDGDPSVMGFTSGGRHVVVAVIAVPIPGPGVEEAAARSWMWKRERTPLLESYSAHAIVATAGFKDTLPDAVASASLVTRVIAAMIEAAEGKGECVAVYWGNGGLLHIPGLFKDMAVEMLTDDEVKVTPLWIGLVASASGPKGPFSVSTYGMEPFGLDDLEIVDSHAPLGDLRMRLYEASSYLLEQGPVFKDGQTFGRSEKERFKIRVGRSKLGKPGRVVRLEI